MSKFLIAIVFGFSLTTAFAKKPEWAGKGAKHKKEMNAKAKEAKEKAESKAEEAQNKAEKERENAENKAEEHRKDGEKRWGKKAKHPQEEKMKEKHAEKKKGFWSRLFGN